MLRAAELYGLMFTISTWPAWWNPGAVLFVEWRRAVLPLRSGWRRRSWRDPAAILTTTTLRRTGPWLYRLCAPLRSEARAISVPVLALAAGDPSGNAILALDLGQKTGWAVRNADGAIASGTVEFKPGRFEGGGMVYLRFRAWLQEVDETAGCDRRRLLRGGQFSIVVSQPRTFRWRLPRPPDRVG